MTTRACRKCGDVKAVDQFQGTGKVCATCRRAYYRAYAIAYNKAHPEQHAAHKKAHRERNAKQIAAKMAAYRKAYPDRVKATYEKRLPARLRYNAEWKAAHPEQAKEHKRRERRNNIVAYNMRSAERRASKFRATPAWANDFFIEEIYDLAQLRSKATGFEWHVDHIVPLKSKLVCGLHVEHNLRVVPAIENITKGNRYWPDMP